MIERLSHAFRRRARTVRWAAPALGAIATACALTLAGCATNPATGGQMISFMSQEDEIKIGRKEHPKLIGAFGGTIKDAALSAYVQSVGQLLARTSELPNLKFTFTVLDTDTVNAFALPGGFVYITRGLLALANSEAEMAGVLAHEIGHVTARHSARRHTRTVFAGVGATLAGIAGTVLGGAQLGQAAGGLTQQVAARHLSAYSREHEFEADSLGVRYLRRAGFDARAMASFLGSLRAQSRLSAKLAGLEPGKVDEYNAMSTHPRTLDRVRRASAASANIRVPNPITGGDIYLGKIRGLIFGGTAEQGFIRGRNFIHPALRFRFQMPVGFHMTNTPTHVIARGPDGAIIAFDRAKKPGRQTPYDYLVNVWAKDVRLDRVERVTINGLKAATGSARLRTRRGFVDLRLVAIRTGTGRDGAIYRFTFVTKPKNTAALGDAFRRTTYSFRRITAREAAKFKPLRIKLVRIGRGDTVASLAGRMAVDRLPETHFRVINGLGPKEKLRTGTTAKLITLDGR